MGTSTYTHTYIHISKKISFKELVYAVMEPGKPEICRAGQQVGTSWAGADAAIIRKNFFFLWESCFCS